MPSIATMESAIVHRLKTWNPLTQLVGPRVYPQATTQDPTPPSVVLQRVGAESGANLDGAAGRPRKYLVRVDSMGRTESEVNPVAASVVDALNAWQDTASGIEGAFHVDSDTTILDDTTRLVSHTFAVWFRG
jgi:hypothetical protein